MRVVSRVGCRNRPLRRFTVFAAFAPEIQNHTFNVKLSDKIKEAHLNIPAKHFESLSTNCNYLVTKRRPFDANFRLTLLEKIDLNVIL